MKYIQFYEIYTEYKKYLKDLIKGKLNSKQRKDPHILYSKRFYAYFEEFLFYGGFPAIVKEKDRRKNQIFL